MFQDKDMEWLQVIRCMKQAGMPLKAIREYIQLAMQGDETISQRLDLFRKQREVLQEKMVELQRTMEALDYKCWYYEVAQEAGSTDLPQHLTDEEIPPRFRAVRRRMREGD